MAIVPEMAADYVRSYWNPSVSGEFSLQRKGWDRRCAAEDDPHPRRVDRNASWSTLLETLENFTFVWSSCWNMRLIPPIKILIHVARLLEDETSLYRTARQPFSCINYAPIRHLVLPVAV